MLNDYDLMQTKNQELSEILSALSIQLIDQDTSAATSRSLTQKLESELSSWYTFY